MPTRTESQLIRRAKEGSKEALNTVVDRYGERLLAVIRLRLGPNLRNQLESRDILQQTLLKAFRGLDRFEGAGGGSLMAWLGAIARNEVKDQAKYFRREGRDVARNVPLDSAAGGIEERLHTEVSRIELARQASLLEQAMEELDPPHREVILLRRFEELSYGEIGRQMDRSPEACRQLHARAMAALTLRTRELLNG